MPNRLYLFSSELERIPALEARQTLVATALCGVGLIDAAIGTVRAIQEHHPSEAVFVGTAGAYATSGLAVGDVVVPREALILSGDVLRGWMRLPTLLRQQCDADRGLVQRLSAHLTAAGYGVRNGTVGCTFGVTEGVDLGAGFSDARLAVAENLEAFGVLRAGTGTVPCAVVLGITNVVGPGGGVDWKRNYRRVIRSIFDALEPGFE